MGVDHIVHLECAAKKALGDGDCFVGTLDILSRKKARRHAELLAEVAAEQGTTPGEMSVTVAVNRDGKTEECNVNYEELLAEAAILDKHHSGCESCAANVLDQPYGCIGAVGYPISLSAERWLIDRVRGAGDEAHQLLLAAIDDFGYDGAAFRRFRERGLIESDAPLSVEIRGRTVTADQLFHALFCVGPELEPTHAFMLLVFIGGVRIDDPRAETVDIGEPPEDLGELELYALFRALASAVAHDVPFILDA
jgi:hypothetical protein